MMRRPDDPGVPPAEAPDTDATFSDAFDWPREDRAANAVTVVVVSLAIVGMGTIAALAINALRAAIAALTGGAA